MIQSFKNKLQSDSSLNELFKGSSITLVIKILGMLVSYIVVMLISRSYGAEGVGIYSLSNKLVYSLALSCALGFNISVLRYVGEFTTFTKGKAYLAKLFKYVIYLSFPFALLISGLVYFFSNEIAENIFENSSYSKAIKLIAAILPFFTINTINVEFIRGLKLLKVSEYLRSINTHLVILVLLVLPILNFGQLNAVYAMVFGMMGTFVLSFLFILRHLKGTDLNDSEVLFEPKNLVKTSIPMMAITISSFILAFSGAFFLEIFSTTDNVGIFNICFMLAQLVSLALTVVNTISAPKFSELYWSGKKDELKNVIYNSSKLIFWFSIIIALTLIFGSSYILGIFGEEFLVGKRVLLILIMGQIINASTGSVGIFLNMTGHQNALRNIMLSSTILVLICYYLITPVYGITGVALVSILGTALVNIISAVYTYKKLGYITFYIPFIKTRNE